VTSDPAAVVRAIGEALTTSGYETSTLEIDRRAALVGRISQFRLRWLAVSLHTFVAVASFPAGASGADELDRFMAAVCRYSIANKGGLPRGFQTGTAAVAVVVTEGASAEAVRWASVAHGRRLGAITYPVVADTVTGSVTHPGRMLMGGVFNSHLRAIAEEIVGGALGPSRLTAS
jgi:hypothetical protein